MINIKGDRADKPSDHAVSPINSSFQILSPLRFRRNVMQNLDSPNTMNHYDVQSSILL